MNCSIFSKVKGKSENATIHGLTPFVTPFAGLTPFAFAPFAFAPFAFAVVLFVMLGGASAQELDFFVRSVAADGRIRVVAKEAEWVPRLSVWSERSLERLEDQWRRKIPFQQNEPFELRIDGDSGEAVLSQWPRGRVLRQRIRISTPPSEVSAQQLAEQYVKAMIFRLQWFSEEGFDASGSPAEPVWLTGAATWLVTGESNRLAALAVERFETTAPPPPELVSSGDRIGSFLLYRWMLDTVVTSRSSSVVFWKQFHQTPDFSQKEWIAVLPEVSTLRELHMAWDVWWAAERQMLISELRLRDATREWLLKELNPVPRFFGLDAEEGTPLGTTSFADFETYLNHPKIESALRQWILRLQTVRFRQPVEVDQKIRAFERSLQTAIRAARLKGRAQQNLWEESVRLWEEALSSL